MVRLSKLYAGLPSHTKFLLPSFALLSVSFSLWMRLIYRGPYYPGWDILGPAHGLFLVSTRSFWDAARYVFHSTRHLQYWNHTNSLLYTLIPGYLGSLWPWEYWAHLLTFSVFLLTLWLIARIAGLPIRQWWILLLGWGASPALLSFSVAGYPYATGFLPHGLAIWITLHHRIRQNWILSLILCLAANELSWHLYVPGKTLFIVFIAAAIFHRNVPLPTRAAWLLAAATQLRMALLHQEGMAGIVLEASSLDVHKISASVLTVGKAIFIDQILDIPALFILGVVSFFFFKRNRWFLLGLFGFQIVLLIMLAMRGADWLRPRRFLLLDFYCILSIACSIRESDIISRFGERPRTMLVSLLFLGNIWQLSNLIDYIQAPVHKRHYPLPFTYSQADYIVPSSEVNWFLEMRSRVHAGEKLLLIYNFSSYPENTTDPAAVLERLYLSLGHKRFAESVFVFGSLKCRYSCLPIHSLEELEGFLDRIRPGGSIAPELVTVYYLQDLHPPAGGKPLFELESIRIFSGLRKRFAISLESPKESKFMRIKIAEKALQGSSSEGFIFKINEGKYEQRTNSRIKQEAFSWHGFPLDIIWIENTLEEIPALLKRPWENEPFSLKISGTLHILARGLYGFLLGSYDGAILKLDGKTILDNGGLHPFQLSQCSLELERGNHRLEIAYADALRVARLLADVYHIHKDAHQSSKSPCFETISFASLFPKGVNGRYYKSIGWSGESREAGPEIIVGESLEAAWTDTPGLSDKPWSPSFSLRLEGQMIVSKPGPYRFDLGSEDGSWLYLDGILALDNSGFHPYREESITVYLKPGKFNFRLDHFDAVGDARLKLSIRRPRTLPREMNLPARPPPPPTP